jgi:PD-(D/E)XK nuclease superfamily
VSRLAFTEKPWHEYTLDGKKVPSVTKIVGAAVHKPALVNAAAKETAIWATLNFEALGTLLDADAWVREATGAARRVWNKRADDGRDLHRLAESMIYGAAMPEEIDGRPVAPHVRDMAGQLARFFDAHDVQPVAHETMVYSDRYRYAGRFDLVADIGGVRWLLDYKTGESGIWPETSVQLSAYGFATHYVDADSVDHDLEALGIERAGAVWIRPNTWDLVPVRYDRQVHGIFLHMGAVWSWTNQARQSIVYSPLPRPEAARK